VNVEIEPHTFYTSAVDGSEWSASLSVNFNLQGKNSWYPLDMRPQSQSGHEGKEENPRNPSHPAHCHSNY